MEGIAPLFRVVFFSVIFQAFGGSDKDYLRDFD
jgi:hypothetical protein